MRAVLVKQPGDAQQLYIGDHPTPVPKSHQVLIKIKCFCLNRMDISQRQGNYPPPPGASEILGVEVSGVVESVGQDVTKFKQGDEVFGLMGGGGYAEYAVMDEKLVIAKPKEITFEQAAAIPETWFTAYQALFLVSELKKGEDILIHAGASGVGIAAIQLAKEAGAKRIFITAGSDDKVKFCQSLGATHGINYKTQNWAKIIAEETSGKGVNVVVDFIGKDYFADNIETLGMDGRMVILAFMSGAVVDNANLGLILRKRLRIQGSTLRSRSVEYQAHLRDEVYNHAIKDHFGCAEGKFKIFIDSIYDWKDIIKATEHMEANRSMGKIVVRVS
ncbi:NADPH:quinone reductase-like protein [Chlamydoabsidia padenii]|nr:NADPH:quinone reductase-like protein [Chlamydoabsidia padenii]